MQSQRALIPHALLMCNAERPQYAERDCTASALLNFDALDMRVEHESFCFSPPSELAVRPCAFGDVHSLSLGNYSSFGNDVRALTKLEPERPTGSQDPEWNNDPAVFPKLLQPYDPDSSSLKPIALSGQNAT